MIAVVVAAALAASVTAEEHWHAVGDAALESGDACESTYYRMHLFDETHSEAAAYYAFQSAYAADLMVTADALLAHIHDPRMLAALAANRKDLDERRRVGALRDAACPAHRPVCGDFIVDEGETCDDGNRIDGDDCDSRCMREPTAWTPPRPSEAAPAPPPPSKPPPRAPPPDPKAAAAKAAADNRAHMCAGAPIAVAVGVIAALIPCSVVVLLSGAPCCTP